MVEVDQITGYPSFDPVAVIPPEVFAFPVPFVTRWSIGAANGDHVEVNEAKHYAFCAYVVNVLEQLAPGVFEVMRLVVDHLIVGPGCFVLVKLDGQVFNIHELGQVFALLPWREASESVH